MAPAAAYPPAVHPNAALIRDFYTRFGRRDAEGMVALYADDVVFSDPVFPELRGEQARNMWRMLCARGKDLRIDLGAFDADDQRGTARWDAYYTFSATGRRVCNQVAATFEFKDGRIARHTDVFDFWRWSRQALGPAGLALGWSGFLLRKVQATAAKGLAEFKPR